MSFRRVLNLKLLSNLVRVLDYNQKTILCSKFFHKNLHICLSCASYIKNYIILQLKYNYVFFDKVEVYNFNIEKDLLCQKMFLLHL